MEFLRGVLVAFGLVTGWWLFNFVRDAIQHRATGVGGALGAAVSDGIMWLTAGLLLSAYGAFVLVRGLQLLANNRP